jgi:membrane protein YdbS with pleckstrin-like domain
MSKKGLTVSWWDLSAATAWTLALAFGIMGTILWHGHANIASFWAIMLVAPAATVTTVAWLSRHLEHNYRAGLNHGLEFAAIIRHSGMDT